MLTRFAIAMLAVPLFSSIAFSQMGRQADALKGMRSFSVKVVSVDSSVISDDQLQTQVELRLRRAGITVTDCASKTVCVPQIFVKVFVVPVKTKGDVDLRICVITIQCNTLVAPVGQPDKRLIATVYLNDDQIYSLESSTIRERINDLIDQFSNDYLSVNPK